MITTVPIPSRLEQAPARYCVETRRSNPEAIIKLPERRLAASELETTPDDLADPDTRPQ